MWQAAAKRENVMSKNVCFIGVSLLQLWLISRNIFIKCSGARSADLADVWVHHSADIYIIYGSVILSLPLVAFHEAPAIIFFLVFNSKNFAEQEQ